MLYGSKFYRQVLVLGETLPIQGNKKLKVFMGPMSFFSKANIQDAARKIRKIVTCIYGVGASLIGRSQFGSTLHNVFRVQKTKILQWCQWALFVLLLILRNLPVEIGDIVCDICHMGGSH